MKKDVDIKKDTNMKKGREKIMINVNDIIKKSIKCIAR
jgi:hypothetical protein